MLLAHSVQSGLNEITIGLEESVGNPRSRRLNSPRAIQKHSSIVSGVLLRDRIRDALTIEKGFTVKCKCGRAQFRIGPIHHLFTPEALVPVSFSACGVFWKRDTFAVL